MNPVSSSEDIKPPLGLNGVLKVPAHPSGNMASFTKHICAICGDRSSGHTEASREEAAADGKVSIGAGSAAPPPLAGSGQGAYDVPLTLNSLRGKRVPSSRLHSTDTEQLTFQGPWFLGGWDLSLPHS
ncbi:hypothetical protein P7K49_001966 [Saguinus oedipus]|uniref:Nuclear/hormone receptor activator site AF-1 domain-containing protein n=1 Tax=Saguinus oedipus TaxID=9490 RepID=A0ABQ9WGG9_SAGOE|nr:hypothetical protein P7K49_001966 [Saguinus oedipus]